MKIKVAQYVLASSKSGIRFLFEHEPVTSGWLRVTEWSEVEINDRAPDDLEAERHTVRLAELADLKKKVQALEIG